MNYKVILLLIVITACNSVNGPGNTKHRDEITQVLLEQSKAWNKGDIDGFMHGYWHSENLRFISKKGMRMGFDSVTASYKRHYNSKEKMGHLKFSNLTFNELTEGHDLVNVCGNWQISGQDSAGGYFSLLFKQIDTQWKIIVDHTW